MFLLLSFVLSLDLIAIEVVFLFAIPFLYSLYPSFQANKKRVRREIRIVQSKYDNECENDAKMRAKLCYIKEHQLFRFAAIYNVYVIT